MMRTSAWSGRKEKNGKYIYTLQVDDLKGVREAKRVIKELTKAGWEIVGEGVGKNNIFLCIFNKEFETQAEWIAWARNTDYPIVEYNNKNKKKSIKLGSFYSQKRK